MRAIVLAMVFFAVISCSKEPVPQPEYKPVYLNRRLISAIRNGDLEEAQGWISKGAGKDAAANQKFNPYQAAIKENHAEAFKLLLKGGFEINAHDNDGWTPLLYAVYYQNEHLCRLLIDEGADINASTIAAVELNSPMIQGSPCGVTPLYAAASMSNIQILELLIDAGADASLADEDGVTPLHVASQNDHLLNQLVNYGADPEARTNHGFKPADYALKYAIKKALQYPFPSGDTPDMNDIVFHLSQGANPDIGAISFVIPEVIPVSFRDMDGTGYALPWGTAEVLEVLLESGMNANLPDAYYGSPLLAASFYGEMASITTLLEYGADPATTDSDGNTAINLLLSHAGFPMAYETIDSLINAGCPVERENTNGITPLSQAVYGMEQGLPGYERCVELIHRSVK